MRNLIIIYIFLGLLFLSCEKKSSRQPNTFATQSINNTNSNTVKSEFDYSINVIGVSDGDTFKGLTQDSIEISFRVHGIDAPERKQDFSIKSKEKLSNLIFGKRVGIKVHTKRDRYGRPVVYVFTPDGLDVGAEMLKAGMAWHYKKYDISDSYSQLELEAQRNKVGLWSVANPIPPWDYRDKKVN